MQNIKRTKKDYAFLLGKGMAMGAADVVPGVSGGTVAFITGIYDELLFSLRQFGPEALKILFKQGIPACWRHVNGWFLLTLFTGILLSLKTFAAILIFALESHAIYVWSCFSGLIGASIILLIRGQKKWTWKDAVLFLLGVTVVMITAIAEPQHSSGEPWMLFLGGFIAICAMILPGISGSFILLLLGLYPVFLEAIHTLDIIALLSFAAGCGCGLLAFSHFLSWLLSRFHQATLSVLIGFLTGSLYVTWPWKQVISTRVNSHGEEVPFIQNNVSPFNYLELTQSKPHLLAGVICALAGFFLVLGAERLIKKTPIQ